MLTCQDSPLATVDEPSRVGGGGFQLLVVEGHSEVNQDLLLDRLLQFSILETAQRGVSRLLWR